MHRVSATPLASIWRWKTPTVAPAPGSGSFSRRAALRLIRSGVALATVTAGLSLTGCQVDIGGQTLPSGYYLQDDIQYFPAGPEFKLSKEAAAQKEFRDEQAVNDPSCTNCR